MNGELLSHALSLKLHVQLCVYTYCICRHFDIFFFFYVVMNTEGPSVILPEPVHIAICTAPADNALVKLIYVRYEEIIYEGWNFNSGNYLFTTDTK